MATITPFLWYDNQAEEAMSFYASIFKNSKPGRITRSRAASSGSNGVMSATFEVEGQHIPALNKGLAHQFTPAISLFVDGESQEEADDLWRRLSQRGNTGPRGWLTGKIRPLVADHCKGTWRDASRSDPARSRRVLRVMLRMSNIDLGGRKRAYAGE